MSNKSEIKITPEIIQNETDDLITLVDGTGLWDKIGLGFML